MEDNLTNIAIVGVTDVVEQVMLEILGKRNFSITELLLEKHHAK